MQNSCVWGNVALQPPILSIPRKPPEEVKAPALRSKITSKFTDRDMEYFQTELPQDYQVFIQVPLRKKDKRATCIRSGSVEYQTFHSS
jgi:hypothetical protein